MNHPNQTNTQRRCGPALTTLQAALQLGFEAVDRAADDGPRTLAEFEAIIARRVAHRKRSGLRLVRP